MPLTHTSRWSLAQRVSLLMFIVLASVITSFGIAAYREVRATTASRGAERLSMVARQAASGAARSIAARTTNLATLARAEPVGRALADRASGAGASSTMLLDSLLALRRRPSDSSVFARELRSADGRRVHRLGVVNESDSIMALRYSALAKRADTTVVSGFYAVDSAAHVVIATPVRRGEATLGLLLEWGRVVGSAETDRVLSALLAGAARVLYTSEGSDVWLGATGHPVRAPFAAAAVRIPWDTVSEHAMAMDGVDMYVGAATVRGTPWRIVLLQSEEALLSRPRALRQRFGLIALALVFLATLAVWQVSRQMHRALESQNDALAEANLAKARFLGVMSHELRTPLNAIAGHAELIALGIHGPTTPAQDQALTRIQRNKEQLLHLVNDLLFFARVDAQPIAVDREPVSLQEQFEQLVANHRHEFERKRVTLSIEPSPIALLADPMRVQQVLANLVSNAWRFTDSGGRVRVRASIVGDRCEIVVQDNGAGIPAADLPMIFEPFVQGDSSATRRNGGAGLGLAIVRALVTAMGGDVSVESAEGSGTTFRVRLPVAAPALAHGVPEVLAPEPVAH